MMKIWDYVLDKLPLKGSWNMAVDDYLFRSLPDSPTTVLRFYSWENPTVSLGYSQKISEVVKEEYCLENGIDIVRRITGGKLVLHDNEVTYSICSSDKKLFSASLSESYKRISEALIFGLKKIGITTHLAETTPPVYARSNLPCFSYPAKNEIKLEEKKIIGSAQKRVGDKFLQHGSMMLNPVSIALGRDVFFKEVVNYLAPGFSEYFDIKLKPKFFSKKEKTAILKIEKSRYLNPEWIKRN